MPTFDAFPRSLGQALTGDFGPVAKPIVVPEWQRNYAWRDTEVDQFWSDLVSFSETCPKGIFGSPQYFLGSIVVVTSEESREHTLLDGQQRLVTASILLAVIRDYIIQTATTNVPSARELAEELQREFIVARSPFSTQEAFRITLNPFDQPYFRDFLQKPAGGTADLSMPTSIASHERLRAAYQTLIRRLREYVSKNPPAEGEIHWSFWLAGVLTQNLLLIVATSDDQDSASEMFEVLNDRGIGLSTPDLLRQLLLRRAGGKSTDEINDYWRDILRLEGVGTDLFLRHVWISREGDEKKHSLYRAMREYLVKHSEAAYALQFTKELAEDALIYQDLVSAQDDDDEIRRLLVGINLLNAFPLRPALLSAWRYDDLAQKKRLLRALTAFYVRHREIVGLENNEFESIVFTLAKNLRDTGDFDAAYADLQAAPPGDDEFENAFATAVVTRQNTVRYLLMEFERMRHANQELAVEDASKVHVEHIYPRNPPASWKAKNHDQIINRLGNLTLLGKKLNTSLQNAKFAKKRDDEVRGYRVSDLKITKELALEPYDKLDYWKIKEINERQRLLAGQAVDIWQI